MECQLRGQDENGVDTGELRVFPTLHEAFEEFLTGKYWKLSWSFPSGRRVRLLRRQDGLLEVTDFAEEVRKAIEDERAVSHN